MLLVCRYLIGISIIKGTIRGKVFGTLFGRGHFRVPKHVLVIAFAGLLIA